jgi:Protein of unknown function (DUF1488)
MPLIRSNDTYRQELDGVYFGLQDGRKVVVCMVSNEALDDYARGNPNRRERIFLKIRPRIEAIASAKYDAGHIETDGTLRVDTRDLNPDRSGEQLPRSKKKPREVIPPRWGVYILKRKAERLPFSVTAPNAEQAIERAIKEYDLTEHERWRISVRREA